MAYFKYLFTSNEIEYSQINDPIEIPHNVHKIICTCENKWFECANPEIKEIIKSLISLTNQCNWFIKFENNTWICLDRFKLADDDPIAIEQKAKNEARVKARKIARENYKIENYMK